MAEAFVQTPTGAALLKKLNGGTNPNDGAVNQ
jgi:hypothetical protein